MIVDLGITLLVCAAAIGLIVGLLIGPVLISWALARAIADIAWPEKGPRRNGDKEETNG